MLDTTDYLKDVVDKLSQDINEIMQDIEHIPTDLQEFASVIQSTVKCLACFSSMNSVCSLNCTVRALYGSTLALVEGTGIALHTIEKTCAHLPSKPSFCAGINNKKCFNDLTNAIGGSCRIDL